MKPSRSPSKSNQAVASVLVQIEKPIYGGAFLARVEGRATFVPLTLPGEQARIRITEERRGYATAEPEEIVSASADRVIPGCRHFGVCGGCNYQHAGYATQLELKQTILRETLERGGVRVPEKIDVLTGEPWGYRNRIRLAFDPAGRSGYRGRRSHAVVPISECPIAAPLLVQSALAATEIVRKFRNGLRIEEISLFCNEDETELLASVFIAGPSKASFDDFAHEWRERIPALRGAELLSQSGPEKPARVLARWGATSIAYRAADFDFRVDHGAFFQVDRWLIDALVDRVTNGYRGRIAWDLFAGVGLFARRLTRSFERVVAVESSPAAIPALEQNLSGTNATGLKGETLAFLRAHDRAEGPDLIVVDPPRTGLGAEASALLARVAAPALVYVSCDPATLARDLGMIIASGYEIQSITLADLFPQTFHLESVVHLRRA
jgi:23S rRNA (uracil1939-C5)-methyltransferase